MSNSNNRTEYDDVDDSTVDDSPDMLLSTEKTSQEYLDDDELFLAGEDSILSQKDALSIFQQSDKLVSYEIMNFYDKNGKVKNKLSLLNDPPILHISSSDQQSADFVLTREFTRTMAHLLKDVDKAYIGISPKKEKKPLTQDNVRQWFDSVLNWAKENKVKAGLLGILVILFVVYTVLSFS